MAGLATHQNLVRLARHPHIGVARQAVPQAHLWVQLRAGLVENGGQQIGAMHHATGIGCFLTHQDFQQCGFTHTVWPHKTNPITAQNADREIAQDGAAAIGLGDRVRLDHFAPRFGARLQLHRGGALAANLCGPFGAQILQRAHAALVALASCADALDRPTRLGLDFAIQLVAGLVFFIPHPVAPRLETVKPLFLAAHRPPVDPQGGPRQGPQKRPVVADQHIGLAGFAQFAL